MHLDDLSRAVTDAILRAESHPSGSPQAEAAFREVSVLEEAIAAIVGATDVEGEIARLGAISAALSAGDPLRAAQLADRYGGDRLSQSAVTKLEELGQQAEVDIRSAAPQEPLVRPVRFTWRAA